MTKMNITRMRAGSRAMPVLAASVVVASLGAPAQAQNVDDLVAYRPDNRAGSAAAASVIAEMIAERSQSAAVRSRARSIAPQGAFTVGADELLMDIGAHAHVAAITGGGSVVPAAVAPMAPVMPQPARPAPPPAAETVVAPPAAPAAAPVTATPTPTAPPVVAATPTPTASAAPQRRQNWGSSDSFSSEMQDRGGSPSGGGGSSGGGGGGGGGGWN